MKHRSRHRLRRGRAFAAAGILILAVAAWHYWSLYTDLRDARADALAAQSQFTQSQSDGGLDLSAGDLAAARVHIGAASAEIHGARRQLAFDPLFQGAHLVPGLRRQAQAVDDLLEIADMLVQVANSATLAGDKVFAVRDAPPDGKPLTASLVQLLADVHPNVDEMSRLSDSIVEHRIALGDRPLLPPLDSIRRRLDKELPRVANVVDEARQSQDLIPGLLGFNGGRHYLVFALNNGEMAPGGGFLSTAGVMEVTDGVNGPVDFSDTTLWKSQWEALGGRSIAPPGPLKRYLLQDYGWNLSTSNWDPDFNVWSQQSLEFYQLVHGAQQVDGIVSVDLVVLERLLAITGPKTLRIEGHGDVTFDSNNAVLTLEGLTRQPSDPVRDRKSAVGDLAEKVIADLLKLPSDRWAEAAKVVRKLGAERHIQVLSYNPKEQAIVRDLGWDGGLAQPAGDYFMFNEASVNSTKLNLLIQPEGSDHIEIGPDGGARHELVLHYENSLPQWSQGKDPALVRLLMLGGVYGGYLRVVGPPGLVAGGSTIDGEQVGIEDAGKSGSKRWFGAFLSLPAGRKSTVTMRWTAPGTGATGAYDLYIQKQAGTEGICLELAVSRQGVAAKRLVVTGGTRDARGRVCVTTDVRVRATF